jgi:beta-carotene ketolase (CrtO type)
VATAARCGRYVADVGTSTQAKTYDVVVVGGGHNGLTCAAFLAKAGKRVLVVEARDTVGGLVWTMEMPNAPGFKVSPCSVEFVLPGVKPSIVDQLELHKHGLRWVHPTALTTWLGPDGASVAFYQDIARTKTEIAKYSRRDAQRYEELVDIITETLLTLMPYFHGHPWRIKPRTVFDVLKQAAKSRTKLAKGARVMLGSIDAVLEEWFEREEIKAPIAAYSAGTFGPITETGTGFHLAFLCGIHQWGVKRPVGGSGAFTQAIANAVRHHGGEVRTGAKVKRVLTHNGTARGVELDSGEQILASDVVCAVDPYTLLTKLLDPSDVPDSTFDQVRSLQVGRYNVLYFDAEMALSGRPKFPGFHDDEYTSTLMLCPTLDYMRRSTVDGMAGTFTDEIPMATLSSSVYDRSLVPPSSAGETLKFYCFNTPIELSNGRSWDDEKKDYFERALDHYELYAPGTRELIIDAHLTAPPDFEERYFVHGGNYEHVDLTLNQLGPTRPIPALSGYESPVERVWHSGAGAFPMAYISGWPGRNTADAVLRGPSRLRRRARKKAASSTLPPLQSRVVE